MSRRLAYIIVFIFTLSLGICKPTKKISSNLDFVNSISPSRITPPNVNICQDFVHTLDDNDSARVENETKITEPREIIKDLLSEDWKRTMKKQYRKFIKKHINCKTTEKKLKRQNLEAFLKTNQTKHIRNGSLMSVYIQASTISFILGVLKTDGVKDCCLQDKKLVGLYKLFKNRVQANLYHTVSDELSNWNEAECIMSASMMIDQPMRCEDITHVIAVTLKDSLDSVKHLWKSMKKLQSQ